MPGVSEGMGLHARGMSGVTGVTSLAGVTGVTGVTGLAGVPGVPATPLPHCSTVMRRLPGTARLSQ